AELSTKFTHDELVAYARHVNEAGEQVFILLQNLLEWSRVQLETHRSEPEVVSLGCLVQDCMDLYQPVAFEKGISLHNNVPETSIVSSPEMIKIVLRNLIFNALKFTTRGGEVNVFAQKEPSQVLMTVSDTGVGMSPDRMSTIFSLTETSSTTGTSGEKGTGLGLPLCKELAELNGGRIWVESSHGEGSNFFFTVPVK
ncbi:MAG: HAMP domain-containing histidine kinase, partial [Alphaproteobacteria bacterium]|nr:HAMP domain-containing histidine kinase [Alphaproteobacteria bacterium]